MKILAINSWVKPDLKNHSPIDFWRVHSPLEELKKHVDWQIDYQPVFLPGIDQYTSPEDFDEAALEKAAAALGEYDIVYSSYQANPFIFALMHSVRQRYGTKYVLDTDDDVYNMDKDSFYWLTGSQQELESMQRQIELAEFVTTTTKPLQKLYEAEKARSGKGRVFLLPNAIPADYRNDQPKDTERVNIGYFGGASHYHDLHETGVLPALEKLMHEHKNVHFTTIGIPSDHYLPKSRYHEMETGNMHVWLEMFGRLNFDIVIAPLRQTIFSEGKSNIKWQEATRMGAAFVGSRVGPYRNLEPSIARLADNTTESWYEQLKWLMNPEKRQGIALNARYDLVTKWQIDTHWQNWKQMFETVAVAK